MHRDMHRGPESDGGLPERHSVLTASALRERQLLLEEYTAQSSQLRQLMRQQREEEGRGPGADALSETELSPVQLTGEFLAQPTPEREASLEAYLRRRSHREGSPVPRARQELFHWDRDPGNRHAARNARQSPEQGESGSTEGLSAAVQRERERYASLLERRRELEETQMRIAEEPLSPGPPPLPGTDLRPQGRLRRSDSDMELDSLVDNAGLVTDPDYYLERDIPIHPQRCLGGEVRAPPRLLVRPSHSLPAVLPRAAEEPAPVPVPAQAPPAAGEHSVLHEIADSLSQLLQFQQQQQQQQQQQKQEELIINTAPIYASSLPPTQFAAPRTPLQQFTSYPPSTPGLPQHQHAHYLPPPYGHTPHHIPYYPGCLPGAPSPMPYCPSLYPGYPGPSPFYAPSAPVCMYHSLPAAAGLCPASHWAQSLPSSLPVPPLLTPPLSQRSRVPVAANCTQTDLTFLENPLSSQQQQQQQLGSAREDQLASARRQLPALPPAPRLRGDSPGEPPAVPRPEGGPQASPLFEQVRERIYSEVASLVSENEARPYYLMELLRAAQLLNTDYLRQAGLSSLKRVINNFLNSDRLEPEAFSAPLSARQASPERAYSPSQSFPLSRHFLDTALSGSSGPAACLPRGCCRLSACVGEPGSRGPEDSDISEITTSDLSGAEVAGVSPWEQTVRVLVTRLIPLLKQHLERSCSPRLLELIHCETMCLFLELFPEEPALRTRGLLDAELRALLARFSALRLRDCGEELLVDVSDLFFSQMDPLALTLSGSLQLSAESGTERESRDRARDDALATAPLETPPVQQPQGETDRPGDETFTLSAGSFDGLFLQGHSLPYSVPPVASPSLSPPRVRIINLTLSESRPLDEGATSERSEDYSHSRTVDTVSETASCTASDLSEAPPSLRPPGPVSPQAAVPPGGNRASSPDSEELPPFACTRLAQGSFTLIPPASLPPGLVDVLSDDSAGLEFTAEVLSLTRTTQLDLTGDSTAIQTPH